VSAINRKTNHKPYTAVDSGWAADDLLALLNRSCATWSAPEQDLANPLAYFETMLDDLDACPSVRAGTVADLATGRGEANLAVRVDVDTDLPAAVGMARRAAQHGVPVSFYLLHTAGYYGVFEDDVFRRHEAMAPLYRDLADRGMEVGLHADPYEVYLAHHMDGARAVIEELAWLRGLGLDVRGVAGHNAAPAYGVESVEIFRGWRIRPEATVEREGKALPVGVLDERVLGLDYEAGCAAPADGDPAEREAYLAGLPEGDFLRSPDWFRTYILDNPYGRWGYAYRVWLLGRDFWAIAGTTRDGDAVFRFRVGWKKVKAFLDGLRPDETCVLHLHPLYLGRRTGPAGWPDGMDAGEVPV